MYDLFAARAFALPDVVVVYVTPPPPALPPQYSRWWNQAGGAPLILSHTNRSYTSPFHCCGGLFPGSRLRAGGILSMPRPARFAGTADTTLSVGRLGSTHQRNGTQLNQYSTVGGWAFCCALLTCLPLLRTPSRYAYLPLTPCNGAFTAVARRASSRVGFCGCTHTV